MGWKILTINPGSTSTKLGLFDDQKCLLEKTIRHDVKELAAFQFPTDQLSCRMQTVYEFIREAVRKGIVRELADIDAFVGRGGLIGPIQGGTWEIGLQMLRVLEQNCFGSHASNLGALIAWELASVVGKPSYIVDPPSTDEMIDLARVTGFKSICRKSIFHALNQKAVARAAAEQLGYLYHTVNLIVCHAGGGISIGVHQKGRVIDVNNALEEGPMSPERAGSLPTLSLLESYRSWKGSPQEFLRKINGKGGLIDLTGTSDVEALERKRSGNPEVELYLLAMAYQIARQIAAGAASLSGNVQGIVLTGGLAFSQYLNARIEERVRFLAPVLVFAGEKELEALAAGAFRVLSGRESAGIYQAPEA